MSLALNLPNSLTLFRIFLVPFIVLILLTEFHFEKWILINREELAILIFLIASLTDMLDGYIARKRKQITTLGTLLDPIADKLLIATVLISLVDLHLTPSWVVATIIGREFAVTGLRMIASTRQITIGASPLGKGKMVLEVIAIVLIIFGNQKEYKMILLAGNITLYLVMSLALISAIQYFFRFYRAIDLFDNMENG